MLKHPHMLKTHMTALVGATNGMSSDKILNSIERVVKNKGNMIFL